MGISAITNSAANTARTNINLSSAQAEKASKALSTGMKQVGAAEAAQINQINSDKGALEVGIANAAQGSSIIEMVTTNTDRMASMLKRMRELAVASNNTALSQDKLDYNNLEFQAIKTALDSVVNKTRWGSSQLLSGGTASAALDGAVNAGAGSADGLNAVANAFAGTMTGAVGHIKGSAESVSVEKIGAAYNVTLTLDSGKVYEAKGVEPGAAGNLNLMAKDGSSIPLDFDGTAVTAITNAATFKSSLESLLGLGDANAAAKFRTGSNAAGNGLTGIASATTVSSGQYMVSKPASSTTITITDAAGNTMTGTAATTGAAQNLTIGGITLTFDNSYDSANAISQTTATLTAGTQVTLAFQTNTDGRDDVTSVNIAGLSTTAMGLTGVNVTTVAAAKEADEKIAVALQTLNTVNAQLQAASKTLGYDAEVAEGALTSLTNTGSVFADADPAKEIADLTGAKVRNQIAQAMLSTANELQQGILQSIR